MPRIVTNLWFDGEAHDGGCGSGRPSIDDVDELCRLARAAQRLGCRVRLVDVDPDLRDVLMLAGVHGLLLGDGDLFTRIEPAAATDGGDLP